MNSYRSLSAKEAADILKSLKTPVILMHARPDGDTAGSCAALIRILRALGIEAQYASADKIPERLAFLLSGERMAENFEERELVAIDVASPSQLGSLSHLADRVCLTIDHHRVNSPFSDNFTAPDASSAAEALFSVLDELIKEGKCSLSPEIAYPMYAAISSDTGGFVFSSASADTYRLAARLIDTGIDFADINHSLFHSKSREQLLAEGFISSRIRTAANGKIAYATLSAADREALSLSGEHFETAIDIIRSLIFSEIAIFVRENDDGTIKASLRSTGFDVASIAAGFGGGGHIRAAGCTLQAKDAQEGAALLIKTIEKTLK
jgi:phosphoesterase RecJ-like protein